VGGAARFGSADSHRNTRGISARSQNLGHANQRPLLTVALGALRRVLAATLDEVDRLATGLEKVIQLFG
jgi:hypothetical protein